VNLLAESLRDFSSDAWWAICDALVDGDPVADGTYNWMLEHRVAEQTRPGDLRRAAASYENELPEKFGNGSETAETKGAYLLARKILAVLEAQGVVEWRDGVPAGKEVTDSIRDANRLWRVTDTYRAIHQLSTGGIRFAYNVDGNWTTYDAQPAKMREARRRADTDRLNTAAAISAAANYQRPVQTGDERSPKYATARQAAFELYESLLHHGYLDAFPVTVNQHGRVVSGNHRLRFAELARVELLAELEQERQNGSDPITIADLERRIASLDRDRIMQHAHVVTRDADEVRVTTASEIQIPWAEHERKQLAKRLATDGLSVRDIADRLNQSERTIREWTTEERTDVKAVQQAEAERLRDIGWSQKRVAEHLGVTPATIRNWEGNSGGTAKIAPPISQPKTDSGTPEEGKATLPPPDKENLSLAAARRQRERLEQVKRLDGRVRPRWTLGDVEDAEAIRRLAGLD
jgi:transposase